MKEKTKEESSTKVETFEDRGRVIGMQYPPII